MSNPARLLARLAADRRGASAVELALISPVFIAALLASIDVARGFSARLDLVQAASRTAELATSLGSVRGDYEFLQSEALAAADTAGHSDADATVDAWLECDGTRQGAGTNVCPSGDRFARYVSVAIETSYTPFFKFGGLIGSDDVEIRGEATVRIQ